MTSLSADTAIPEWLGSVTITHRIETTVFGKDTEAARREFALIGGAKAKLLGPGSRIRVDLERQLSGPWVRCGLGRDAWYDLHGPADVIVLEASYGNRFTDEDIALLTARIKAEGLGVSEHWNGSGCGQVSFRCTGREPKDSQFTKEQLARLLAPRPAVGDAAPKCGKCGGGMAGSMVGLWCCVCGAYTTRENTPGLTEEVEEGGQNA